jgi:hypothetical protein
MDLDDALEREKFVIKAVQLQSTKRKERRIANPVCPCEALINLLLQRVCA